MHDEKHMMEIPFFSLYRMPCALARWVAKQERSCLVPSQQALLHYFLRAVEEKNELGADARLQQQQQHTTTQRPLK